MSEKKEYLAQLNKYMHANARVEIPVILRFLPDSLFSDHEKGKIIDLLKENFPGRVIERRLTGNLSRDFFKELITLLEKKDLFLFATLITDGISKADGQILNVVLKSVRYIYPGIFSKYISEDNVEEFARVSNTVLYKFNDILCRPLKMLIPKKSLIKQMDKVGIAEFVVDTVSSYSKLIEEIGKQNQALAQFFIESLEEILNFYVGTEFPLIKIGHTELTEQLNLESQSELFTLSLKYWLYFNWYRGEDPLQISENVNNMAYIVCRTFDDVSVKEMSVENKKLLAFSLALLLYCKGSHKKRNIIKEYVSKKEIVFFRYHIYFEGLIRNIFN